jgi:hypothetical protein
MRPESPGFAVSRKRHRARSPATLPLSIDEPCAVRVPARSAFGSVHVDGAPLPPQPASTSAVVPAATSGCFRIA